MVISDVKVSVVDVCDIVDVVVVVLIEIEYEGKIYNFIGL